MAGAPQSPSGYDTLKLGLFTQPDRESFIVSPRRRLFVPNLAVALPVGATPITTVMPFPAADILRQDDGFLIEYLAADFNITLGAGAVVTVTDMALQVGTPFTVVMPLATPVLTTLQPRGLNTLIFPQEPLITARDLDAFTRQKTGSSIFTPGQQPLNLFFTMTFADTVLASTVSINLLMLIRFVQGLMGA